MSLRVAWLQMHKFSDMSILAIITLCFHSSFGSIPL